MKLHPLLTIRGTALASADFPVKPAGLNEYEYADWAAAFLRELPEDRLIMRLTAEAEPEQVITPKWWMSKGQFLAFFHEKFLHPEQDGAFESVTTADGSPTLYHPGFRQHFHTLAGAATEAERKFVIPSRLRERLAAGKPVRVLDVGFGLGVNCAAALRCGGPLEIITLENDPRVLGAALRLYPGGSLEHRLIAALDSGNVFAENGCRVELIPGDARDAAGTFEPQSFDVIFQDGFSPDCNPELWSYDFVRALARALKPDGVLVSYSSAYPYRGALLRAGLAVGESEPFGRKRGGTVAAFDPSLPPLPLPEKERGIILASTAGDSVPRSIAARHAGGAVPPPRSPCRAAAPPRRAEVVPEELARQAGSAPGIGVRNPFDPLFFTGDKLLIRKQSFHTQPFQNLKGLRLPAAGDAFKHGFELGITLQSLLQLCQKRLLFGGNTTGSRNIKTVVFFVFRQIPERFPPTPPGYAAGRRRKGEQKQDKARCAEQSGPDGERIAPAGNRDGGRDQNDSGRKPGPAHDPPESVGTTGVREDGKLLAQGNRISSLAAAGPFFHQQRSPVERKEHFPETAAVCVRHVSSNPMFRCGTLPPNSFRFKALYSSSVRISSVFSESNALRSCSTLSGRFRSGR